MKKKKFPEKISHSINAGENNNSSLTLQEPAFNPTIQSKPSSHSEETNNGKTPFNLGQENTKSSNKLPEETQFKMEEAFGHNFSDVNIFQNSGKASQLRAKAFTQGENIHFAPGEYDTQSQNGQSLIGHELSHVVQQRNGIVKPTIQKKGFSINNDESLEKEANQMGEKAAQGYNISAVGSAMSNAPNQSVQRKKEGEGEEKKTADLDSNIQDYKDTVTDTTGTNDRLVKAESIIDTARSGLSGIPAKVNALKHNGLIPVKEKTQILGQLMAAIAKMEFLLGKLYYKGQPTMERKYNSKRKRWDKTSNSGTLIDHYKSQLGLNKSSSYAWCTMFVGSVHKAIGADNASSTNFLSGLRMRGKTGIDEKEGGKMVGLQKGFKSSSKRNPWHKLKDDITACKTDDEKKTVLDDFLSGTMKPQAGDSMVVGRSSAKSNSFTEHKKVKQDDGTFKNKGGGLSHTTMVEKFEDYKIYTIEGNKGHNVTGRMYDLKKPSDIAKIIYVKRFGFSHIDSGKAGNHKGPEEASKFQSWAHEMLEYIGLVYPVQETNSKLLELVDDKASITDTAYKLDGNKSGGSDS